MSDRGVLCEPDVERIDLDGDNTILTVASDGIWEFMPPEKVLDVLKFGLKKKGPEEALRQLVKVARGRWQHYEGSICDDITALIVEFNR